MNSMNSPIPTPRLKWLTLSTALVAAAGTLPAEPWANDPRHNMVHEDVSDIPAKLDQAEIVWSLDDGWKHQYPMPTMVDGHVLVGADASGVIMDYWKEAVPKGGTFTAYRLEDGSFSWQLIVPGKGNGVAGYGVCTTPLVQGERVYIFALDEILCLDLNGLADGNQGYQDELAFMTQKGFAAPEGQEAPTETPSWAADILWRHSLKPYELSFQDATSCSMIDVDGYLWVSTSHQLGTDAQGWRVIQAAKNGESFQPGYFPKKKPYLIVLDKENGELVAVDDMDIPVIYHGQWSSPSLVTLDDGRHLVVFPDGYGVIHGFEVPDFSQVTEPLTLRPLWSFDVNLPEWRTNEKGLRYVYTEDHRLFFKFPVGYPEDETKWIQGFDRNSTRFWGPAEIIGMPAVKDNRVYVAVGRDGYYSSRNFPEGYEIDLPREGRRHTGPGRMVCLEIGEDLMPTLVWENRDVFRTQSTPSVYDGMIFIADTAGMLHCLDQATGTHIWRYDLGHMVECRSQIVADGHVYISSSDGLFHVLKADAELQPVYQERFRGDHATVEAFDGHLILSGTFGMNLYLSKKQEPTPSTD